ncbi:MAG: type II toxin-antitoxin system RelE/ParE family toxin [bacterium]|nr:type II toxin-antitoxin system RelE/ParE family toxin [bacterium]
MEVKFFDIRLQKFIISLEKPTHAKVLHMIDLLEQFGSVLGMPHSKKISPRLFELRVRGVQEVRIIYAFHNGAVMLLHGFIKKAQKIPTKELRLAYYKLRSLDII